MPKSGGTAEKLSSPAGVESFPKFSPDGRTIAFSGNYDGNLDAYTISSNGGIPVRLTQHGMPDRVVDWTTDGKRVLFASGRESGQPFQSILYHTCQWRPCRKTTLCLCRVRLLFSRRGKRWPLRSYHRLSATGNVTEADGDQ